jgi:hypothetical protein
MRPLHHFIVLLFTLAGCPAGNPTGDAAATTDTPAGQGAADSKTACTVSADCVLVHWGCCEDPCQDGLSFSRAVNQMSAASVYRLSQCGKVCSAVMACGFEVSTTCDRGRCVVNCTGGCPSAQPQASPDTATTQP